jgi:hypothetical protein
MREPPRVGRVFANLLWERYAAVVPPEGGCSCETLADCMDAMGPANCLRKAGLFSESLSRDSGIPAAHLQVLIEAAAKYVRDWKPLETS